MWKLNDDKTHRKTGSGRTQLAASGDVTLMTPDGEPLCDWAGDADESGQFAPVHTSLFED